MKDELIYEFWLAQNMMMLLAKYRARDEDTARRRFRQEYPEYEADLDAGKVRVTSRKPRY